MSKIQGAQGGHFTPVIDALFLPQILILHLMKKRVLNCYEKYQK